MNRVDIYDMLLLAGLLLIGVSIALWWGVPAVLAYIGMCLIGAGLMGAGAK